MSDNVISAIDPGIFRNVMGHYPTGVVVVTGRGDDGSVLAMVVGTFSSVSMDPPLVSFMPMKTSRTFEKMRACESLCINILGGEQEDVVLTIAQRWEDKLAGIDWFPSPSGDPVLADSVAWIDTRISNVVEAGDHSNPQTGVGVERRDSAEQLLHHELLSDGTATDGRDPLSAAQRPVGRGFQV